MNSLSNFYDTLDLKYPEIGIAMDKIDRVNPGKIKFIIPILTPNMNNSRLVDQTVYQNTMNLKNKNIKLDVQEVQMSNYIEIELPRELCSYLGGKHKVLDGVIKSTGSININDDMDTFIINAKGTVSSGNELYPGYINVDDGYIGGYHTINSQKVEGWIELEPVDRYIDPGSKWIIVFVGGDITKPKVIGRYE